MRELRVLAAMRDASVLLSQWTHYLAAAAPHLPLAELHAILAEASAEDVMPTIAEELREQGYAKGQHETLRQVLRKQLTLKFGEIPEDVVARVEAADLDELERYVGAVLTAQTIDAVFA